MQQRNIYLYICIVLWVLSMYKMKKKNKMKSKCLLINFGPKKKKNV